MPGRKACPFFLLSLLFWLFGIHRTSGQTVLPDEVVISYQCNGKALKKVLKDLSEISKVSIVYSENKIPSEAPVTVNASKEKLGDVLTVILKKFDFKYQLVGNQLVVVKLNLENLENEYIISGYIRDAASKEYLISAAAYLADGVKGTYTNEYGFFSLKLPRETNRVHFSYLGYKTHTIELYLDKNTNVEIFLTPEQLVLNEVLVSENQENYAMETPADQQMLGINKINKGNHLMGESDAFRYISMLPGVNTGADGVGGLNIRGGSYDQNLVLLDGVPLYNTGHALGIFSVFNASSVKNVNLVKGAFPARYGGRLSSVVDVQTKDGNMEKTSGEASMSLISLKAGIEGPIIKNKLSYHISVRRTFLDIWLGQLARFIGQEAGTNSAANYYFYDLNGKINWQINPKNRFIVNAYTGRDRFTSQSEFREENIYDFNGSELGWGNQMFSARWSSQWNANTFSKFTAYTTSYNVQSYKNYSFFYRSANDTLQDFWGFLFDSSIRETGTKFEIDWIPAPSHYVKFGTGYFYRQFAPGTFHADQQRTPELVNRTISMSLLQEKISFVNSGFAEWQTYLEDDWVVNEYINIQAGVHGSLLQFGNGAKPYLSLQPRFAFMASNDPLVFKLGLSNMMQYVHLLSNSGLGLPTDIWVGAGENLAPQTSWIYNASLAYKIRKGIQVGLDVYYKNFRDLTHFNEGEPVEINPANEWINKIPVGKGEAYGAELYFEKSSGKTQILASYTYSVSNRIFDDLNVGRTFPFAFNREHNIKCNVYRKLSDFAEFSMNWTFASGNHYSRPDNVIVDVNGKIVLVYPEKNNAQFDAYHRLDIGFGFFNKFSWGKTRLFLGLYNVYNRRNYFYTDIARNRRNPNIFEINNYSLLPLTPNISYTVTF